MLSRRFLLVLFVLAVVITVPSASFASLVGADLAITKTDGSATATPGAMTVYTIVATNNGPSDVTGGTVADTFSPILTCTWTCTASAGSSCTAAGAGNINDSVNLLNGGTATYTATCSISAAASGSLINTATVSSALPDSNMADNSATDTDTLTPSADLSVTKTDGATSATPGGSVVYTITVSNGGPSNVMGSTLTDTFPATLSGCTWTCTASAGSSCTAAGAGNISDNGVNLVSGGTATYTATCSVDPAATGNLANTATISSAVSDPNMANNSATDTDTLAPSADLSVSGTITPNPVQIGSNFTVDVTVTNAGPSDASGVVVTTTLPASASFLSTTGCTEDPNGVPTCTLGTVPAGGMASFSILAQATAAGSDPVMLSVASNASDPNGGNDTATVALASQSILEIPTTTQVGKALMALLLLGAAILVLRRV